MVSFRSIFANLEVALNLDNFRRVTKHVIGYLCWELGHTPHGHTYYDFV
jgi:hypothetical protein